MTKAGGVVAVESTEGFAAGMRAYIRGPAGTGEYFDVTSVISPTQLGKSQTLTQDYPETSGVYAIDERRFFLQNFVTSNGPLPELQMQIGNQAPQSFAVGIEKLNIRYQLRRNCPPCDVVDLPADNSEWSIVEEVLLNVTARSELPDANGNLLSAHDLGGGEAAQSASAIVARQRRGLLCPCARVLTIAAWR